MRKLIITLAVLVSALFSANAEEKTKTYDFGDIKSLNIGYNYQVHVTEGNSDQVKIVYDSQFEGYMDVTYNKDMHKLNISMKDNLPKKMRMGHLPRINVYLEMNDVARLDISGAASVDFEGEFKSNELDINLSGASKISQLNIKGKSLNFDCSGASKCVIGGNFSEEVELDLSGASRLDYTGNSKEFNAEISGASKLTFSGNCKETEIRCSGASSAKLEGSTDNGEYECSGASMIEAKDFVAKNLHTVLSGASKADVHATANLTYSVSRACKITYYGDAVLKNLSPESNVVRGN